MALSNDPTTQDALSMLVLSYNKNEPPERQLNDTQFVFFPPTVVSNPAPGEGDTNVEAKPLADSGKYGVATMNYDRLNLGSLTDLPLITRDENTTLADVVAQLNQEFGINIVPDDYDNSAVITGPTVTLVATPTSWLFKGQVTLTFAT